MRTALLALVTLAAATTTVRAEEDPACGETELSEEALAALEDAQEREEAKEDDAGATYRVPVYLHVVRRAPGGEGDMPVAHARAITVDRINAQLEERGIPFALDLVHIDYTTAPAETYHLKQNSAEEKALYDLVNVGGRRKLNIYLVGPRSDTTVTGWAEFLVNPALKRGDHVVLRYSPETKDVSDPFTPIHEFGHWMGLLHTFHFGCGKIQHGDLIYDTPTQAKATHTCSADYDSCPNDAGTDPIDNIMGYSQSCRSSFSPGQIKRMKFLWRVARGGKSDDEFVDDELVVIDDAETTGCAATPATSLLPVLFAFGLRRRRRR